MIRNFILVFSIVVLIIVAIVFLANKYNINHTVEIALSAALVALGWVVAAWLHVHSFTRSEIIKNKDYIISLIENLFNGLRTHYSNDEEPTVEFLDDYVTVQVTKLEIKLKHISNINNKCTYLISDTSLSEIRQIPLIYKKITEKPLKLRKLYQLEVKVLEEIDESYSEWINNNKI